ncbi:SUPPRESSOR OF npr1-1 CONSTITUTIVE 1 protein [Nymphaea thermarum]|nr:SUPPRESSOR OF npr1-1 CONSTITUTIVE 1 protein [Nymphaea thermarum]
MLARLKAAQHKGIHEKLKISYDVLEEEAKTVFLDIACFFVGQRREYPAYLWIREERQHASHMWQACDPFLRSTINVLMRKCLVSINDDSGEFEMHDQIRGMGRKIVKDESPNSKPEMRSRLWKSDEALDVLQNKTGTEKIEAIQLNSGIFEEHMYVEAESFIAMSELRMLRLGKFVHLKGEFQHFPKKLRWLQWCIKGHLDSLPDGLHLENIAVLDLSNSLITQLWNPQGLESTKVFGKMKVLKLTFCGNLTSCPDFTSMPHLQKLNLKGCSLMSELHPSIRLLKRLTHLSLSCCRLLKRVPQEIWQLSSLEELDLSTCYEFTTLPSQMEDPKSFKPVLLDKLKVLDFSGCYNLISCPDFTSMPHLQKLNFFSCHKMSELHPSIGLLKSLTYLDLHHCRSLKELHPENWQLISLEELDLLDCSEITTLPSQLWNCKSLARLSLGGCKSLMELPEAVCQLTSLKMLIVFDCKQLEIIPDVSSLKGLHKLDLSYCNKIVNVLGIQDLDKLKELDLCNCENLIRCPLFSSNMTHLQRLDFRHCAKMTELDPSIGHLKSLSDLLLDDCKSLKELPQEVSQLKQLKWLSLHGCSSLTEIPDCIWSFLNLEQVDLSWTAIEEMPHSIVSLENLESLSVSHCYRLKLLPSLPPSLTILDANGCRKLEDVPDIEQIKLLEVLYLGGCRSLHDSFLERLEEANFQNLGDFSISGQRLSSYPQSLSFLLPKQFDYGTLYLHVDKRSLDNICSELDESSGSEREDESIPSDEVIDSQPGRVVLIEIATGDAKFQFSAPIKIGWHKTSEEGEFRDFPTATFGRDSELRKMAEQGEFIGNDDARLGTMMTMRVSIDGCVLLHGDLRTYSKPSIDWIYPYMIEADDNLVIVEFDWPF